MLFQVKVVSFILKLSVTYYNKSLRNVLLLSVFVPSTRREEVGSTAVVSSPSSPATTRTREGVAWTDLMWRLRRRHRTSPQRERCRPFVPVSQSPIHRHVTHQPPAFRQCCFLNSKTRIEDDKVGASWVVGTFLTNDSDDDEMRRGLRRLIFWWND